jgi:peptidyl-prolyl cis-trans isomerase A (cyclophilin A)
MICRGKYSPLLLCIFFLMAACTHPTDQVVEPQMPPDSLKEGLELAQQTLNKREENLINQYVERHELKLTISPTGLRYIVYKKGKGGMATVGNVVRINYRVGLINGIEVDNSDVSGSVEIRIEKSEAVSGLHELLQKMNRGAKARAIIPSYLGYGFTGDQERIPKGATLIYDVEILDIKQTN